MFLFVHHIPYCQCFINTVFQKWFNVTIYEIWLGFDFTRSSNKYESKREGACVISRGEAVDVALMHVHDLIKW